MVRSLFGSASAWGSLAVLALTGTASAQWFPFGGGNSCNCGARPSMMSSAPIMQSASYSAAYNPVPVYQTAYASESVSCGQPVACTITQPVQVRAMAIAPVVQTVRVQAMQTVIHPVYDTVHVTEYQPVKQTVQRPVVETQMIDQTVTEMRPVVQQRTVNVPTVEYQSVTEIRQVQKQVGYYATKTEAINKAHPCQYDNRANLLGWMNRSAYQMRSAVTPNTKVTRTFVPQTMTCAVPVTKKVAIQGMKQVTYNVTSMVPTVTTRKVAVNQVRYVTEEITAMKPVTTAKMMQVGTRVSYAPVGSTGGTTAAGPGTSGPTALTPTPDTTSSARRPSTDRAANGDAAEPLDPKKFSTGNGQNLRSAYPTIESDSDRNAVSETVIPSRPTLKTPSVVRVSQWVARTPSPSSPQLDKSAAMSIAGTVR